MISRYVYCICILNTKPHGNAKISAVRISRYLFSARSYVVNYVYYLVYLLFGIFGVKYFAYSYIGDLFIRIRPSGL